MHAPSTRPAAVSLVQPMRLPLRLAPIFPTCCTSSPHLASIAAVLALTGCWGRNIPYEGGESSADSVAVTTCGQDADLENGFSVTGSTLDFGTGGFATAGLCITAVDPTPAITGGTPTVLSSSEVCDDGSYVVAGIQSAPSIGMFLIIDDCDGEPDTVMKTAAGIAPTMIAGMGDGDQLVGVQALSVSLVWAATEQADLERLGWSGDLATTGYMAGIIEDVDGAAVSGATVTCNDCVPQVYYQDGDGTDGIYGVDTTANLATDSSGGGLFMIPAAPIFTYSAGDGGQHTWASTLLGSLPGYAVYIRFTAS